jgi:hypothetical protein
MVMVVPNGVVVVENVILQVMTMMIIVMIVLFDSPTTHDSMNYYSRAIYSIYLAVNRTVALCETS